MVVSARHLVRHKSLGVECTHISIMANTQSSSKVSSIRIFIYPLSTLMKVVRSSSSRDLLRDKARRKRRVGGLSISSRLVRTKPVDIQLGAASENRCLFPDEDRGSAQFG